MQQLHLKYDLTFPPGAFSLLLFPISVPLFLLASLPAIPFPFLTIYSSTLGHIEGLSLLLELSFPWITPAPSHLLLSKVLRIYPLYHQFQVLM